MIFLIKIKFQHLTGKLDTNYYCLDMTKTWINLTKDQAKILRIKMWQTTMTILLSLCYKDKWGLVLDCLKLTTINKPCPGQVANWLKLDNSLWTSQRRNRIWVTRFNISILMVFNNNQQDTLVHLTIKRLLIILLLDCLISKRASSTS